MTKFKLNQWITMRISVAIVTLLPICTSVPNHSQWEREFLASTEIPAEHIDPGSIDLTPLMNTLLNASHAGSEHLFSVLSVTSHSSLALHKITLLVYNISSFQDIETTLFPLRYCYCVTNKTNDLTDFTAILLDVMGNSTSYLQELFKSSSILSVNQMRSSDCIYICVMAGKTDSDQSELWDSVPPLFNHTIMEHTHTAISADFPASSTINPDISLTSSTSSLTSTTTTAATSFATLTVSTTGHMTSVPSAVSVVTAGVNTTGVTLAAVSMNTMPASILIPTSDIVSTSAQTSPARSTAAPPEPPATTSTQPAHSSVSMTTTPSAHPVMADTATEVSKPIPAAAKTSPATSRTPHVDKPGCPWQSELIYRGSQRKDQKETLDEDLSVNNPTVSITKLQPCVFELCKFFSQCLCRGFSKKTSLQRYCIDSHFWYEKHTAEVCSRVRRLTFSKSLKQKCLAKMCVKM